MTDGRTDERTLLKRCKNEFNETEKYERYKEKEEVNQIEIESSGKQEKMTIWHVSC